MVINIVHISDLQAGQACLAEAEVDGLEETHVELRYRHFAAVLADDIERVLKAIPSAKADLLVFSGDIVNRAREDEYRKATIFLSTVVEALGIAWRNVLVVPGNHDVDWAVLEARFGKEPPRGPESLGLCAAASEKMSNFATWLNGLYESHGVSYRYAASRPLLFRDLDRDELAVVGLDSCGMLTHNQEENHGFVGRDQLSEAIDFFRDAGEQRVKLAFLHHNPFVHQGEDSASGLEKPAGLVQGLTGAGVALLLAGHMHRPQFRDGLSYFESEARVCHILVAGPCCMTRSERKLTVGKYVEVLPNRYQVISIDPQKSIAAVRLRRFSFERRSRTGPLGDWTVDTDPGYVNGRGLFYISLEPAMEKMRRAWTDALGELPQGLSGLFELD